MTEYLIQNGEKFFWFALGLIFLVKSFQGPLVKVDVTVNNYDGGDEGNDWKDEKPRNPSLTVTE